MKNKKVVPGLTIIPWIEFATIEYLEIDNAL
jgi:hypothetical protein